MPDAANPTSQQEITLTTNLKEAPAHAEALGHLCVAWANLEWNMFVLFDEMTGAPHALARAAFHSVESSRGKREMLLAAALTVLEKQGDKSVLDDILRRIAKTSRQRNKYVHDTWIVAQTQNKEVAQLRLREADGDRDMQEVHVKDIEATTQQIEKLTNELGDFRKRVSGALPPSLDKLRKLPSIRLVFAKKGHPPGRLPKGHHGRR